MKDLGFYYITKSGFSYGIGDLPTLKGKKQLIEEGDEKVEIIEAQYKEGLLTKRERYTQIIKVWTDVKDRIQQPRKRRSTKRDGRIHDRFGCARFHWTTDAGRWHEGAGVEPAWRHHRASHQIIIS